MHILITGAAGMVGRKLVARLANDQALGDRGIDRLTLLDVTMPGRPDGFAGKVETVAVDPADKGTAVAAVAERPDAIFHLAAVPSGEAEFDFDKGMRANFDGSRALFDAIRAIDGYRPRLVFASSIAVFGAPFPNAIPDDFANTPLTSYGTQKAMTELLLYPARLPRRCWHPATKHRGAAGAAEQCGVRIFLFHHPRAARRRGGGAAGRG